MTDRRRHREMRRAKLPSNDVELVRPQIRNLRARAIDGKSQMLIWDKPVGGLLVGYSIRFRVNGVQHQWEDVPNQAVHWGGTHHAVVVPIPSSDPEDVIVGVRAANVHRHSNPVPETHLAADYKVIIGDSRHEEPRKNKAPNRPYLFMMREDEQEVTELASKDLKRRENLFEWAARPAEWSFTNRTYEEIMFLCRRGSARRTLQPRRMVTDPDGTVHDICISKKPVDARIDDFDYEPDLSILTTIRGSFVSLCLPSLEHPVDNVPDWSRDLQEIGLNACVHEQAGRMFHPFDEDVPGCWGIATRVVAACETGNRNWLTQDVNHALQACNETWDGRIVGGYVRAGVDAFCFRDYNHGLVVQVEYKDNRPPRTCVLTSPHIT